MRDNGKITLIVAILSLLVASLGLILSDNVRRLTNNAEIVAVEDSVDLEPLIGQKGVIATETIVNKGTASSSNFRAIFKFDSVIPKYEIISDEKIGDIEVEGLAIKIPIDRLSINSSIKLIMYSPRSFEYSKRYIDDTGNYEFLKGIERSKFNTINLIFLIVIFLSLFFIVFFYKKASETVLISTLEAHQTEINRKIREVRDEVENIEVVISDVDSNGENGKGLKKRLGDFISKF